MLNFNLYFGSTKLLSCPFGQTSNDLTRIVLGHRSERIRGRPFLAPHTCAQLYPLSTSVSLSGRMTLDSLKVLPPIVAVLLIRGLLHPWRIGAASSQYPTTGSRHAQSSTPRMLRLFVFALGQKYVHLYIYIYIYIYK